MTRARVVVIIPALDEEAALPLVLQEIPRSCVDAIVVVDNGSRDRTAEVAARGGARVVSERRRGYGRACLTGIELAERGWRESGTGELEFAGLREQDVIVFLDADHSDYPEELEHVVGPILDGSADFVIGSRILGGATMDALAPQAWFGNRLACVLMRGLFGAKYTDLGPFRAIRVRALRHLRMCDVDFGWTVEMQLKAAVARLRVVEVPVRYRPRIGTSKITGTVSGTVRAGAKILGWIFGWRVELWLRAGRIPTYQRCARIEC